MHYWDGGWHMGWMVLWWVVIIGASVAVIWLLLSRWRGNRNRDASKETLKRRYARGDLDRNTFLRMWEDLKK